MTGHSETFDLVAVDAIGFKTHFLAKKENWFYRTKASSTFPFISLCNWIDVDSYISTASFSSLLNWTKNDV